MAKEPLLKPKDVALRLNVSCSSARNIMRKIGAINVTLSKGSEHLRIDANDLEAWISRSKYVLPSPASLRKQHQPEAKTSDRGQTERAIQYRKRP